MRLEQTGTRLPWAATRWLIGHRLRRRWAGLLPLVLIVALGGASAFVSFGAAERTANAYSRYLARADVGDVVINPSPVTPELDEAIRALPGVVSATSDGLFFASLDDGAPRTVGELAATVGMGFGAFDPTGIAVTGSVDGRGAIMDRPAIAEGRLAEGPREAFVSSEPRWRTGWAARGRSRCGPRNGRAPCLVVLACRPDRHRAVGGSITGA